MAKRGRGKIYDGYQCRICGEIFETKREAQSHLGHKHAVKLKSAKAKIRKILRAKSPILGTEIHQMQMPAKSLQIPTGIPQFSNNPVDSTPPKRRRRMKTPHSSKSVLSTSTAPKVNSSSQFLDNSQHQNEEDQIRIKNRLNELAKCNATLDSEEISVEQDYLNKRAKIQAERSQNLQEMRMLAEEFSKKFGVLEKETLNQNHFKCQGIALSAFNFEDDSPKLLIRESRIDEINSAADATEDEDMKNFHVPPSNETFEKMELNDNLILSSHPETFFEMKDSSVEDSMLDNNNDTGSYSDLLDLSTSRSQIFE